MKNRLDEFTEDVGVVVIGSKKGEPAQHAWSIATRPRSQVTHQEMGVMKLTISPPPADSQKTRWGVVLLDALHSIEGFDGVEHLADLVIVREDDDLSSSGHLKDRTEVFKMTSFASWYYGIELAFPGLLEAFSADDQLRFVALVFQAVSEGDEVMAVGDNEETH